MKDRFGSFDELGMVSVLWEQKDERNGNAQINPLL